MTWSVWLMLAALADPATGVPPSGGSPLTVNPGPVSPESPPPMRQALPPDQHSAARLPRNLEGYWYGLQDHHYFAPPLADVNAPRFYMRFFAADAVPFTKNADGVKSGDSHQFWDVGFGSEFNLIGRDNADRSDLPEHPNTLPAGWSFFIDGDAHMLLDFSANSAAVIDTEFRTGGGLRGRGIPWVTSRGDLLSHLCWRLKVFHESTHIGDEYEHDAPSQLKAGQTFRRVNVSYEAVEAFLALDAFKVDALWRYLRLYAGYRRLLDGPYDLDPDQGIVHPGKRNEAQVGGDARRMLLGPLPRWCNHFLGRLLCPDAGVLGADLSIRQQFDYTGTNADPQWLTAHAVFGFEWGEVLTDELVFRFDIDAHWGVNPHGQFREDTERYLGVTLQFGD